MQTSNRHKTPREAFDAVRTHYALIQKRLDERLVANAARFARESGRWDLVGDEERILHYLALALAAAGDRSAAHALEQRLRTCARLSQELPFGL